MHWCGFILCDGFKILVEELGCFSWFYPSARWMLCRVIKNEFWWNASGGSSRGPAREAFHRLLG